MNKKELREQVAKIINSGHVQGYDISMGHVMDIIDLIRNATLDEKWIPINERSPDVGTRVLVWSKGVEYSEDAIYVNSHNIHQIGNPDCLLSSLRLITHWMYYPKLPI